MSKILAPIAAQPLMLPLIYPQLAAVVEAAEKVIGAEGMVGGALAIELDGLRLHLDALTRRVREVTK